MSGWQGLCCSGVFTFHKTLFYNLAQALHVGLGQVLAALGLLQPFIGPSTFGQTGRPWLGDVVVFAHGVDVASKRKERKKRGRGASRATRRRGRSRVTSMRVVWGLAVRVGDDDVCGSEPCCARAALEVHCRVTNRDAVSSMYGVAVCLYVSVYGYLQGPGELRLGVRCCHCCCLC